MYLLGLDVGTRGARVLVCSADGEIVASASETFVTPRKAALSPHNSTQNPDDWWSAASSCLRHVTDDLRKLGIGPEEIRAMAVDSTSGTIVPLDEKNLPLAPAIMYNDTRAAVEAEECNARGTALTDKLGYRFSASFSLPKILWIKKNEPQIFRQTDCFVHPADYLVGRLTGNFHLSDSSNALKTGYDLVDRSWPDFIETELGIPKRTLPEVVAPGCAIGTVSKECAQETGLSAGMTVVAGVTDGTAGFFASGASKVGDCNSTIGSTLVLRGISSELIKDPKGRIYCHSHPQGYWLPGGASSTGAECLTKLFHGRNLDELNAYVPMYSPTSMIVYPLVRKGERFPFCDPNAEGFTIGEPRDSRDLYAAYLEGVGFVERWSLEVLESLGAPVGDTIFTTGGGAKSIEWMQVRANILNRRVVRPKTIECALGSAVVAGSSTLFPNIEAATSAMVKIGDIVEPDRSKTDAYDERYAAFRKACAQHGYA